MASFFPHCLLATASCSATATLKQLWECDPLEHLDPAAAPCSIFFYHLYQAGLQTLSQANIDSPAHTLHGRDLTRALRRGCLFDSTHFRAHTHTLTFVPFCYYQMYLQSSDKGRPVFQRDYTSIRYTIPAISSIIIYMLWTY